MIKIISYLCLWTLLISCKTTLTHKAYEEHRSPSQLKALYDSRNFLMRATKAPHEKASITFEVCRILKVKDNITLQEDTCIPAFLLENDTPLTVSLEELSERLTEEDVKLIKALQKANTQYLFSASTATSGVLGGTALSTLGTTAALSKATPTIKRVIMAGSNKITQVALRKVVNASAMAFFMTGSIALVFTAGGGTLISLSQHLLPSIVEKSYLELQKLQDEQFYQTLRTAQGNYKDLGKIAGHWEAITSSDPGHLQESGSVFKVLHDMAMYFKHTPPFHQIHRWCYPMETALKKRCKNI